MLINKEKQLGFEGLIKDISAGGKNISTEDIFMFLCGYSKEERVSANKRIGEAYINAGLYGKAQIFIQRAWLLSGFSSEILPAFVKVHVAVKDHAAIREAYKRSGIEAEKRNEVAAAISFFNLWQYAFAEYERTDKHSYDFDILDSMARLSEPFQLPGKKQKARKAGGKIKIAYIIYSFAPALHKLDMAIAEYSDHSRFEIVFFIPEKTGTNNIQQELISKIKKYNYRLITSDHNNDLDRALEIARKIAGFGPDIIYNSASMVDFWHYFITLLFPQTLKVALMGGPPPLYVTAVFDLGIAESHHLRMESLANSDRADLQLELPDKKNIRIADRHDFNIPGEATILVSGGRYTKFQEKEYWKAIADILTREKDAYLIIVGVTKDEIPFIDSIVTAPVQERIRFLSWRADYLNIYAMADIAIDTYPQSGAIVMIEAMALGIPVVTFKNDFLKLYDQVNMSLAHEFCDIPGLMISRDDFDEFKEVVCKLIRDKAYREQLAVICAEKMHTKRGNPRQMVKDFEQLFTRLVEESPGKNKSFQKNDRFRNIKLKTLLFEVTRSVYLRISNKIKKKHTQS